jgi:hypothetical protein
VEAQLGLQTNGRGVRVGPWNLGLSEKTDGSGKGLVGAADAGDINDSVFSDPDLLNDCAACGAAAQQME